MLRASSRLIEFSEEIELSKIRPSKVQLRSFFEGVEELAASIFTHGLLEPIIVRPENDYFEVVAGNRRLSACKLLRWKRVPCHIVDLDDKEAFEVAIVENVQRKTLTPIEEAKAYRNYVSEHGWGSISELAGRIGKSQEYVSKRLRLLDLPSKVIDEIISRRINPSTAEELLSIDDTHSRAELGILIARTGMTRHEVREMVKSSKRLNNRDASVRLERQRLQSRSLKKALAVLRITMMRIDEIIEDIGDDWLVKEFLMERRRTLHDQISVMIRFKMRTDKLCRNGAINPLRVEEPLLHLPHR
ncbi:MAG: ParB/RepB/Spo0J family partition protein [Thaumarchaeota archaeon]|nr:ParB/RepB/Spo0J family partition protein [Nitrososphaerota archaeon]